MAADRPYGSFMIFQHQSGIFWIHLVSFDRIIIVAFGSAVKQVQTRQHTKPLPSCVVGGLVFKRFHAKSV
jgi:hypothetical protein